MDPPPLTIGPTDSWWDDPATPLTREFVLNYHAGALLWIFDEYARDPRKSGDCECVQYYMINTRFGMVPCEVRGNGDPIIMAVTYHGTSLNPGSVYIDCRILSRGESLHAWNPALPRQNHVFDANMVYCDIRTEFARCNNIEEEMVDYEVTQPWSTSVSEYLRHHGLI